MNSKLDADDTDDDSDDEEDGDKKGESEDEDDDDDDDEAELLRELEKIKKERAMEQEKKVSILLIPPFSGHWVLSNWRFWNGRLMTLYFFFLLHFPLRRERRPSKRSRFERSKS